MIIVHCSVLVTYLWSAARNAKSCRICSSVGRYWVQLCCDSSC